MGRFLLVLERIIQRGNAEVAPVFHLDGFPGEGNIAFLERVLEVGTGGVNGLVLIRKAKKG